MWWIFLRKKSFEGKMVNHHKRWGYLFVWCEINVIVPQKQFLCQLCLPGVAKRREDIIVISCALLSRVGKHWKGVARVTVQGAVIFLIKPFFPSYYHFLFFHYNWILVKKIFFFIFNWKLISIIILLKI